MNTLRTMAEAKFGPDTEKILVLGIFLIVSRHPHTLEANVLTFQHKSAFKEVQSGGRLKVGTQ